MSQRLNTSPTPADAASALASTTAIHPELANRKDIPLTAFDFLDGAYAATKRARAIGIGVLGLALLLLSWTVFNGLQASWEVADVRDQVTELKNSRGALVGEFGESVQGVPTEALLTRERVLSAGFAGVTNQQGNFLALFDQLRALETADARIASLSYGLAADPDSSKDSKKSTDGSADDEAAQTAEKVTVRILISGSDLSATVGLADRIRQVPGLENVAIDLGGSGASVVASISLNKPPQRLLDRLVTLGVRPDAATRAGSDTADADTTDEPAASESGS